MCLCSSFTLCSCSCWCLCLCLCSGVCDLGVCSECSSVVGLSNCFVRVGLCRCLRSCLGGVLVWVWFAFVLEFVYCVLVLRCSCSRL